MAANGAFQAEESHDQTGFPRKSSLVTVWKTVGDRQKLGGRGHLGIVAASQEEMMRLGAKKGQ